MPVATAKMTIRLPEDDLFGAKRYAARHGLSLTGLVIRHFERLVADENRELPGEIAAVAGILPRGVDPRAEYAEFLEEKHS